MKPELERYAQLLRDGPPGLLSRSDTDRVVDHIDDALVGADHVRQLGASSLVDVGSGGGLPGIPLAVEVEGLQVHLVESLRWKADFLERCRAPLNLDQRLTVHCLRAEDAVAALGRESIDVATARALAAPAVVAEYLAPFVRISGELLLWTTSRVVDAFDAAPVAAELGLASPIVVPAPSALRTDGVLLVWSKLAPTPERYPRRTGVASRRPLGA